MSRRDVHLLALTLIALLMSCASNKPRLSPPDEGDCPRHANLIVQKDASGAMAHACHDEQGREVGPYFAFHPENPTSIYVSGHFDKSSNRAGTWRWYYPDGTLAREVGYRRGALHGPERSYRSSGIPFAEARWRRGELHGPACVYYANGRPRRCGEFKRGLMEGKWRWASEEGKYRFVETYEPQQIKHVFSLEDGTLLIQRNRLIDSETSESVLYDAVTGERLFFAKQKLYQENPEDPPLAFTVENKRYLRDIIPSRRTEHQAAIKGNPVVNSESCDPEQQTCDAGNFCKTRDLVEMSRTLRHVLQPCRPDYEHSFLKFSVVFKRDQDLELVEAYVQEIDSPGGDSSRYLTCMNKALQSSFVNLRFGDESQEPRGICHIRIHMIWTPTQLYEHYDGRQLIRREPFL